MQAWRVSVGLTVSVAGVALLLVGSHLDYLAPYWRVILAEYGVSIALHGTLALAAVAGIFYGAARAIGLADLGRKVDLVERSIRRGEGDRELAAALQRDAEGQWD